MSSPRPAKATMVLVLATVAAVAVASIGYITLTRPNNTQSNTATVTHSPNSKNETVTTSLSPIDANASTRVNATNDFWRFSMSLNTTVVPQGSSFNAEFTLTNMSPDNQSVILVVPLTNPQLNSLNGTLIWAYQPSEINYPKTFKSGETLEESLEIPASMPYRTIRPSDYVLSAEPLISQNGRWLSGDLKVSSIVIVLQRLPHNLTNLANQVEASPRFKALNLSDVQKYVLVGDFATGLINSTGRWNFLNLQFYLYGNRIVSPCPSFMIREVVNILIVSVPKEADGSYDLGGLEVHSNSYIILCTTTTSHVG